MNKQKRISSIKQAENMHFCACTNLFLWEREENVKENILETSYLQLQILYACVTDMETLRKNEELMNGEFA